MHLFHFMMTEFNGNYWGFIKLMKMISPSQSLWQRMQQPIWPHHSSVETTPLVTSSTACWVQISHARLQVSAWPHGAISDRWLSTSHQLWSPHAMVGWHWHVYHTSDEHLSQSFAVAGRRLWNTLPVSCWTVCIEFEVLWFVVRCLKKLGLILVSWWTRTSSSSVE